MGNYQSQSSPPTHALISSCSLTLKNTILHAPRPSVFVFLFKVIELISQVTPSVSTLIYWSILYYPKLPTRPIMHQTICIDSLFRNLIKYSSNSTNTNNKGINTHMNESPSCSSFRLNHQGKKNPQVLQTIQFIY